MNYVITLIVPPFGVLFTGHLLAATCLFFVWGASVAFLSPFLGHGLTVVIALMIMLSSDSSLIRFLLAAIVPPMGVMFNGRVATGLVIAVIWIGGMILLSPIWGHVVAVSFTYAVMAFAPRPSWY